MRTNSKLRMALANAVIALVFLLGVGAAQALTFETSDAGSNVTAIRNMMLGGTLYDITFVEDTAQGVYGPPQFADFDFVTAIGAEIASIAVNAALNFGAPASSFVGPDGQGQQAYIIGFATENIVFDLVFFQESFFNGTWGLLPRDTTSYLDTRIYADFTVVPELGTALLLGLGLGGLGVAGRKRREESKATA